MPSVIDFLEFKGFTTPPALVLVGLHQHPEQRLENVQACSAVLSNCRMVLARARECGIPIAHVRTLYPKSASSRLRYPPWIAGFEPMRSDMVFDLLQPSCYSNMEFSRAMDHSNGNFAIAGMFGHTTCLATAIDAHHRGHEFSYLADAIAFCGDESAPAHAYRDAVGVIMAMYGTVTNGARWSRRISLRQTVC